MNKMFITKFSTLVENDTLPILGELTIKVKKSNSFTNARQRELFFSANKDIEVYITGGGTFVDRNDISKSLGTTAIVHGNIQENVFYISNNDCIVHIKDKYSLTGIGHAHPTSDVNDYAFDMAFDLSDIKFSKINIIYLANTSVSGNISSLSNMTSLSRLYLANTSVSGNISSLSNMTSLSQLNLSNTSVSGNISSLSNMTSLSRLNLSNTSVSGNISSLSNMTSLSQLNLSNTSVSGNISSLSNMTSLSELNLSGTSVSGNISSLSNMTSLSQLNLSRTSVSGGELSALSKQLRIVSLPAKSSYTWVSNKRTTDAYIFSCAFPINVDNVDNMLIDLAKGKNKGKSGNPAWEKLISLIGVRTSASNDAITTLTNNGYYIHVNSEHFDGKEGV